MFLFSHSSRIPFSALFLQMSVHSEGYYKHKGFSDIENGGKISNVDPPKEVKGGKDFVDGWHKNGIPGAKEDEWKHCGKKEGYKIYKKMESIPMMLSKVQLEVAIFLQHLELLQRMLPTFKI